MPNEALKVACMYVDRIPVDALLKKEVLRPLVLYCAHLQTPQRKPIMQSDRARSLWARGVLVLSLGTRCRIFLVLPSVLMRCSSRPSDLCLRSHWRLYGVKKGLEADTEKRQTNPERRHRRSLSTSAIPIPMLCCQKKFRATTSQSYWGRARGLPEKIPAP